MAIFGLGEAGTLIAADLVAAGLDVAAFDPAPVATPPGVRRCPTPAEAVAGAEVVVALTPQADARVALTQALADIPAGALYADLSTSAARLKAELAELAGGRGLAFVDVAMMSIVPGNGIRLPALASGTGAHRFVTAFRPLGMDVEAVAGPAGLASTHKLLRSVVMKGLAALVIEAVEAAAAAGCSDWLWANLAAEIDKADGPFLARLVKGTGQHAVRRLHEMEASAELLRELGIKPVMTDSTVETLRRVPAKGVPVVPLAD